MKGFILAVQFLTRLPTPRIASNDVEFAHSMRWFPAVGLVVGALVAGAGWLGAQIDGWLGALAALLMWVGVTGALHLDGLADLADASGAAHKDRERLLAVLADPHVGSFGVVAIVLQLIAKLLLLQMLVVAGAWLALLLIPFAARIGPLVWARLPLLHTGLASRFSMSVRPLHIAIWAAILAGTAWVCPPILIAPILILGWGLHLRRKFGGISGDGHGAGIEIVESGLLLVAILWTQL